MLAVLHKRKGMDEGTFLEALHADPGDEVTWLALADWLEEDGQTDRAELLRLVRRLRALPVMKRTRARVALEDRVATLLLAGVRPVVPEITNAIGMRLALIPPGVFRMGSPANEPGRSIDEVVHQVEITRPFYLGVFAVTQKQYARVMGHNPSYFSATGLGRTQVAGLDTDDFPAEHMLWSEAIEFCQRLSLLDRKTGRNLVYRLPTEAEWEYACRGGSASTSAYHVGPVLTSTQANFNGSSIHGGIGSGPFLGRPCRVGSYRPNVFGLYDMHGNISEWCADRYGDYPDGERAVDPRGATSGRYVVVRNGSAGDRARACRSAHRIRYSARDRNSYLGFRVAATVVS